MILDPLEMAGGAAAIVTALGGAFALGRGFARRGKGLANFLEDWNGEPARKGVPARPGVMERLANVEKELTLNGGRSLKDTVVRMAGQLDRMAQPVTVNVTQSPPAAPQSD